MKKEIPKTARIWSSHVENYESSRVWIFSKMCFYWGLSWLFTNLKNRYLWCVCGYSRNLSFNGWHRKAIALCTKAISRHKKFLDRVSAAKADLLHSLAEAYFYQGNYGQSIELIKESKEILEDPNHQSQFPDFEPGLANSKMLEGKCQWKQGFYYEALECYCEALALYLENGYQDERSYVIGQLYSLIGQVYIDLEELEKAKGFIGRAKKVLSRDNRRESLFLGAARNAEARLLLAQYERSPDHPTEKDFDAAKACLDDAAMLFQKAKSDEHKNRFLASVLSNRGQLSLIRYKLSKFSTGNQSIPAQSQAFLEEAKRHFEQELDERRDIFNQAHHPTIGRVYAFLSEISYEQEYYKKAAELAQLGIISVVNGFLDQDLCQNPAINEEQLEENFDSPSTLLLLLRRKAEALYKRYERGEEPGFNCVFDALKSALELSELLRNNYNRLESRYEQIRQARNIQELALELMEGYLSKYPEQGAVEQDILDELFQIVQRSQTPLFGDIFHGGRLLGIIGSRKFTGPNAYNADSVIMHINQAAIGEIKPEVIHSWCRILESEKKLSTRNLSSDNLYRLPFIKSVGEFQEVIDRKVKEKVAIISYFVGERSIFATVVTRESRFIIRKIPFDKHYYGYHLRDDVSNFIPSMEAWSESRKKAAAKFRFNFPLLSHRLYQKLIKEASLLPDDIERVYFIPDQELISIPFEILLTENIHSNYRIKDVPFLFKRLNISYHTSLSVLFNKHGKDGIYETNPLSRQLKDQGREDLFCGLITRLYDKNGAQIIDKRAKQCEETLGAVADEFIRHRFSSHTSLSLMEKQKPLIHWFSEAKVIYFSGMLQGNPDTGQPEIVIKNYPNGSNYQKDYTLSIENIQQVTLNFHLMIFNVKVNPREKEFYKYQALSFFHRAFLNSPGKNILFSLRPIPDDAWHFFITSFFKRLFSMQEPYSKALQYARNQLLRHKKYSHPKYWSGLVFWGNQTGLIKLNDSPAGSADW